MLWDVWVIDLREMSCCLVRLGLSKESADCFSDNWMEPDSLVVLLPAGFCLDCV